MPVLGCVPYINAKPIIARFHEGGPTDFEVVYEIPSRLPSMLDSGEACAVLASSFEALSTAGRTVAADVSISTMGRAESVRLFSKVHPATIASLALDQSSLTSNGLAQIVLWEAYGVQPSVSLHAPELDAMLANNDACVLIGDNGMEADAESLHVLDLGKEWERLTGLPFVWALWIANDGLTEEIAGSLVEAKLWGMEHREEIVLRAAETSGWGIKRCERYLNETMNYDLTERHLQGLDRFRAFLIEHHLIEPCEMPKIVSPAIPVSK